MRNLDQGDDARQQVASVIAETLADALVLVLARRDVVDAARAIFATAEKPLERTSGLTKQQVAKALGVSCSTIDRLVREGMPVVHVGDHRRFDLADCGPWLRARGKRATSAKTKTADNVDISDIASAAGLVRR
jgi:excisionase family DNA binding protein